MYEKLLRPLLFQLDPETAHNLAKNALRQSALWRLNEAWQGVNSERLATKIGRLSVANPIGLSAGFDKNAEAVPGLNRLGFGYITLGSICPEARSGNPRPRLLRLPEQQSLLNCYGLPSDGLATCVERLQRLPKSPKSPRLIANIDAPDIPTYLAALRQIQEHVDVIEIGTQCPNNTDDHGEFTTQAYLQKLLPQVMAQATKPVLVKILPYENEQQKNERLELAEICAFYRVDAITLPGTWRQATPNLSLGYGQASGRMVFEKTLQTIRELKQATAGRVAIKANGGIYSGADAFAALAAGAASVDVLASFVYRGWNVANKIKRELLAQMDAHGIRQVSEIGR